jgi:hypothetical protein
MLGLVAGCVGSVLAAAVWRAGRDPARRGALQGLAVGAGGVAAVALVGWLAIGPLATGWASRAGTPASLLGGGSQAATTAARHVTQLVLPATSSFDGTATQQQGASGGMELEFHGTLSGNADLVLDIRLTGQIAQTGGFFVQGGRVTLGPRDDQHRFTGQIAGVEDGQISSKLEDHSGDAVTLDAALQVLDAAGTAGGRVQLALAG